METPFIEPINKITIDTYGLIGSFEIDNKSVKVKYFSTKASSRDKSSGEFALLKELKPMRERVPPNKLKNLNSLLQRDLSDARVATELVPYLKKPSKIAFFPAILAVLIPSGFIMNEGRDYPTPEYKELSSKKITSYGDCWSLTAFQTGNSYGPLGMLSIDSTQTDIIVLDGQHRANAFRFLCGVFANDDADIHSAFYQDISVPESFNAELPVTLVWFESEEQAIDPTLISRNLFVDVNNSARKVSNSRNILLNDREVTCLLTRFLYSAIARKASFKSEEFSLLHSAFDIDSELTIRSGNIFTLTNPELIEYTISWFLFDWGTYDTLEKYRVSRENARNSLMNFENIFNELSFNRTHVKINENTTNKVVELKNSDKIGYFENQFIEKLLPVFYGIFNDFHLFRQHYTACRIVEEWRKTTASSKERTIWDTVFRGGEGLYYTLVYSQNNPNNQWLDDLRKAVEDVEGKLSEERYKLFPNCTKALVDQAFESIRTKAFHVGIFMALKVFNDEESFLDSYGEFVQRLNQVEPSHWIYILTKIKPELIPSVDPKSWPSYQKLILRIIQSEGKYYNAGNFLDSPDGKIFEQKVKAKFTAWVENEDLEIKDIKLEHIKISTLEAWAQDAKAFVDDLFKTANIPIIEKVERVENAKSVVNKLLNANL
ncbi:DNA sulfur modification protein DndB [Scytonema sp. NUACC26]|uniref:DNA sulfur modification protein DndB n=1 Tax=Scytonema sp. NUACC26 TaxID=3140176 RepID=UPI0034DC6164